MRRDRRLSIQVTVIVVLAAFVSSCSYNKFTTQEEAIKARWGEVQNQLQRRNDLIPNLVETVKGYAAHEEGVYKDIADSRSKLLAAKSPEETIQAANQQTAALGRLLAVVENYPQLRANEQFNRLMDELVRHRKQNRRRARPVQHGHPGVQHPAASLPVERHREGVRLQGVSLLRSAAVRAGGAEGGLQEVRCATGDRRSDWNGPRGDGARGLRRSRHPGAGPPTRTTAVAANQRVDRSAPQEFRLARDRPGEHRRPRGRHRGGRKRSLDNLRRLRDRRRLEIRQQRHDLDADLRRIPGLVHRRHRHCSVQPRRRLRRDRRAEQQAELVVRRRRVQVDRRRQDVRARRSRQNTEHRTHRRPSEGSEHRLCCGRRTSVRSESRPRVVQDHRRRQDLDEHEVHRQRHGLHRCRDGSVEPERSLRGVVPAAPHAVGLQRRRSRERHLEDQQRRQELDEADRQRPANQSHHRPHRPRHRALQATDDLCLDRGRADRRHGRRRERRRNAAARRTARLRRRARPRRTAAAGSEQVRHLAIGRRWEDVEISVELDGSADVLQPDPG